MNDYDIELARISQYELTVHGYTNISYSNNTSFFERENIPVFMNWYDKPKDEHTETRWFNLGRKVFTYQKATGYVKPNNTDTCYAIYSIEQTWLI